MHPMPAISAGVLAGGRGRRMGGRDKGLIPWRGRPMASWIVDRLKLTASEVLISANRNIEAYRTLGADHVIEDGPGAFAGPLAGIVSLRRAAREDLLLIVPCDCPELPDDLAARLYQAMRRKRTALAAVHDGNRLQPLFVLLAQAEESPLRLTFQCGQRAPQRWLQSRPCALADLSDCRRQLCNINTPDALYGPDLTGRKQMPE